MKEFIRTLVIWLILVAITTVLVVIVWKYSAILAILRSLTHPTSTLTRSSLGGMAYAAPAPLPKRDTPDRRDDLTKGTWEVLYIHFHPIKPFLVPNPSKVWHHSFFPDGTFIYRLHYADPTIYPSHLPPIPYRPCIWRVNEQGHILLSERVSENRTEEWPSLIYQPYERIWKSPCECWVLRKHHPKLFPLLAPN